MTTSMLIRSPWFLAALALSSAGLLQAQSPGGDCCANKACRDAAATLSSTPFLAAPAGPLASGRAVFVGELSGAGGKALFEGDKPEVKPLAIDATKATECGGKVDPTDPSVMIDKDGGIANVVILVAVAGAELKVPEKPLELDQKNCRFEPHVVVIPAGSSVEFLNSDVVGHNVHTYPKKGTGKNETIAPSDKRTWKYEQADQIEIKCDIHPWMNAWLIVTDAPFSAVTNEKGEFQIEGLPAGTHEVEFWHEKLGKNKGEITVAADGTGSMSPLEWGLEEKASGGRRR